MEFKDRLKLAIENKGVTPYAIGRDTKVSKVSVRNYLEGAKPSLENLNILSEYLGVSVEWLATGKERVSETTIESEERQNKMITIPQSTITVNKRKGALIYDIDATCGFDGRDIEFVDEKVVGSIDAPEINPESKIIFATGDSMLPLITSGDRIVIRRIESWDYFNYGQVYLIITNEYRFIKRVRKHPKDEENLILLRSENPDYDDIDLPKKEIIHLFIVENILAIKNIL